MTADPYRSTPIFDEKTLPAALRSEHRTKAGVWGVIRVLAGSLRLTYLEPPSVTIVTAERPAIVLPEPTPVRIPPRRARSRSAEPIR